jgi:hypothetical protein
MAYSISVSRLMLAAALLLGLACTTKTVGGGATSVTRNDAGPTADPAPDDPTKCMVFQDADKRDPGQACTCATDCTTGNCDQGVCCSGKACGAKRPEGAPCTESTQCSSNFCADGVCCNVACTGACLACNQPEMMGECAPVGAGVADPHMLCRKDSPETCGQSGVCNGQGGCAKYAADTVCKLGSCQGEFDFIPPGTCDGQGTCQTGTAISCSPSKCAGTECVRVCTSSDQCVAGKTCLSGSCGKFGPGQTCEQNSQCESNFCVDGVCCESACTELCMTCAGTTRGKCAPVAAGVSDAMCPVTAASTCGTDGKCDGMGECSKYDVNTTCRAAKCDAATNTATMAAKCDDGVCPAEAEMHSCAPFKGCNGNSCVGTCGSDNQCEAGSFCTAGSCGKRPVGGKCAIDQDCGNGLCFQGFCCNVACDGVCKSCALPGKQGTCSNVPNKGVDVSGRCPVGGCTNGCDGKGACAKAANKSVCGDAAICTSDFSRNYSECDTQGNCIPKSETCPMGNPVCKAGACSKPNKGPGEMCLNPGDCASGHCIGNICCNIACGECTQCAPNGLSCIAKDGGTCSLPAHTCRDSACVPVCAPTETPCTVNNATVCIADLTTNQNHCGACNHKCLATEICQNSACVFKCDKTVCMVGAKKVCVDPLTDKAHCGGCGKACGTTCTNGACAPATCVGCTECQTCNTVTGKCDNKANTVICSLGKCNGAGMCKPLTCANCTGDCKKCDTVTGVCGIAGAGDKCSMGKCNATGVCEPQMCANCTGDCKKCNTVTGICGIAGAGDKCSIGKCNATGGCVPQTCPNCTGDCKKCNTATGICGVAGAGDSCSTGKCNATGGCVPQTCPNCTGDCKKCNTVTGICGVAGSGDSCSTGKCNATGGCVPQTCPNCTGDCKKCNTVTGICGLAGPGDSCSTGKCNATGGCVPQTCSNCTGDCKKCNTVTGICGVAGAGDNCSIGKCNATGGCEPLTCPNCTGDCKKCNTTTGICGVAGAGDSCSTGKCNATGGCEPLTCPNCTGDCKKCNTTTGICGVAGAGDTCSTGKCNATGGCEPLTCPNCGGECQACDTTTGTCGMKNDGTPCGANGMCKTGVCDIPPTP